MTVDVRLTWPVVGLAAGAHAVGALATLTAGFLVVPAATVVLGNATTMMLSLGGAFVLHTVLDAVFAAAMRRMRASAVTCVLNLVLARIPVVVAGVALGAVGGGVVSGVPANGGAASDSGATAFRELAAQAGLQTGWAVLSVVVGVAVGIAWVRVRGRGAER